MKVNIKTGIKDDRFIIQETTFEDTSLNIQDQFYQQIIDTQENEAREALIKLGWKPPQ